MRSTLSAPHFHDEAAAYEFLEARVWPTGPVCPHCGGVGRISKMQGNSTRLGVYKCYQCRKQFRATVGTVFEASHVPLNVWLQAVVLLTSSKKGFSSNQLSRILGVTLKTAWFMSHRIRLAMADGAMLPLGGNGGIVEADETYIGRQKNPQPSPQRRGAPYKQPSRAKRKIAVISLVERGGKVRSFHVENADKATVTNIVNANIDRETRIHTDESRLYTGLEMSFADHETVNHGAREYARGDVTTNSVEGFFSIFKRGMTGVYQHCAEKNLHRYLSEFDFRYNNRVKLGVHDAERADIALAGIVGKRLMYGSTTRG